MHRSAYMILFSLLLKIILLINYCFSDISIQPLQPVNNSAEKSAVSFDYQDIAVQLSTEIVQSTDDTSVPAGFVVYSEIANFIGGSAL